MIRVTHRKKNYKSLKILELEPPSPNGVAKQPQFQYFFILFFWQFAAMHVLRARTGARSVRPAGTEPSGSCAAG